VGPLAWTARASSSSRAGAWLPRGSSAASLLMSFQINLQEDAPWLA
jgi:hypothetical protein